MGQTDLTDQFKEWKQQAVSDLPGHIQIFLRRYEADCRKRAWQEERGNLMDEVFPGIWISGDDAAQTAGFLEQNGITFVLNMAREIKYDPCHPDVNFYKVGIEDGALTKCDVYPKVAELIDEQIKSGKKVLIHCAAGISRSVTAVISYKMLYCGMKFSEALEAIIEKRIIANPHPLLVRSIVRDFGDKFIP